MALWEYKVITSGQHGFATPTLLEAHLNALGKDEWEIIHFQTLPNNPLAFNGLVRRSTMRDWAPPVVAQAAPAPAARPAPAAEADAAPSARPAPAQEPAVEDKAPADDKGLIREETLRPVRDTDRDLDPEADDEEDDWDDWEEDGDELPTFFEAVKPHMRRNQKGPGMAVGVDYLAKRWDLRESDVVNALKECGITVPESEDSEPEYFEFEGDLYWLNRNNRGQLFLNTREKPRAVFRTVQAAKLSPDDPAAAELSAERAAEKAEAEKRNQERLQREAERQAAAQARAEAQAAARAARQAQQAPQPTSAPVEGSGEVDAPGEPGAEAPAGGEAPAHSDTPAPTGADLLEKIRPHMRRNRRGPGYSGSTHFLARALKCSEKSLIEAFAALGLEAPANAGAKPVNVDIGNAIFWMNRDGRGGLWINGRENRGNRPQGGAASGAPAAEGHAELTPAEDATKVAGDPILEGTAQALPEGSVPVVASPDLTASSPGTEGSNVTDSVSAPETGNAGRPEVETPVPSESAPSDTGTPPTVPETTTPADAGSDATLATEAEAPVGEVAPEVPLTTPEPEAGEETVDEGDDPTSEPKEESKPKKRPSRPRTKKSKAETPPAPEA